MIRLVLTSVLFLLILTSTAASQFVYNLTGAGTRAQGMGNAFLAVSDDASAASWNPAGMTVHEKLMMGFDLNRFAPDNEFQSGSNTFFKSNSFSSISQLSIVVPFRFRGQAMVFGFNYSKTSEEYWSDGLEMDSIFENRIFGSVSDTSTLYAFAESWRHPDLAVLNFAFATKTSSKVSVGASVNIYLGSSIQEISQDLRIHNFLDPFYDPQYVVYDQKTRILDTTAYSGVNFTGSMKYDGDMLDVGLVIKAPFDLSAETDRKIFSETYYNGDLRNEGTGTIYQDNQLVKTEIPWSVGLGIAVTPVDNLLLAIDGEYSGFSGTLVKTRDSLHIRPGSSNEEFYTTDDLSWRNSFKFRIGAEYEWHTPWDLFPIIPIRAGFSAVAIPVNELLAGEDIATAIGATQIKKSTQNNISFGLGVKWSQIFLDASLTLSTSDLPVVNQPGDLRYKEYSSSSSRLAIGFTGYF